MKIKKEIAQAENITPLCRLCHCSNENFQTIDIVIKRILGEVFLNLDLNGKVNNIICNACLTKLNTVHDFKSACVDTEATFNSYLENDKIQPVNLMDICVEEKVNESANSIKNLQVCRLCMQATAINCTPFGKAETEMVQMYIPEVNLDVTQNPVICNVCIVSLTTHVSFIKDCLALERTVKKECEDYNEEMWDYSSERQIKQCELEIKSERILNNRKQESDDEKRLLDSSEWRIKQEELEIKSEGMFEGTEQESADNLNVTCKAEVYSSSNKRGDLHELKGSGGTSTSKNHSKTYRRHYQAKKLYQCNECSYQSKYGGNFNTHKLQHADPSTIRMFQCTKCSFETKYFHCLKTHQLTHADPSEIVWFKCDICSYQSNRKDKLNNHKLRHADPSKLEWLKCHECSYQSKFKHDLKRHELKHAQRKIRKVANLKCDKCSHESKCKSQLRIHKLKHADPTTIEMLRCDTCSFTTKYEKSLNAHKLKHADPSTIAMFKCDKCSYQTYRKYSLKDHKLQHADPAEIKMYKCDECSYQTKRRGHLKIHRLRHADPSEIEMHKCNECSYQTNRKSNLKGHMLRHADPSRGVDHSPKNAYTRLQYLRLK